MIISNIRCEYNLQFKYGSNLLDIFEKHTILDLLFHQMINGLTILTQFKSQQINK